MTQQPSNFRAAGTVVIVGVALTMIGLGLIWLPLAFIAGGAFIALLGVLLAKSGGTA